MAEKRVCELCSHVIEDDSTICDNCGAKIGILTKPNEERTKQEIIKEEYFSFTGRLNRKPFIIRSAIVTFIYGFIMAMDSFTLMIIGILPIIASSLSLTIRRIHDLGYSGYAVFVPIVPVILLTSFVDDIATGLMLSLVCSVINLGFLGYLIFKPGNIGDNAYGSDPLK